LKRRESTILSLRAPALAKLDDVAARTIAVALPALTLGIAVGIVRLQHRGGSFDALMAVTVLTCAVYAAYLALRRLAGWRGFATSWGRRRRRSAFTKKRSRPRPLVIAVTMLTSLSQETLGEIGVCDPMLSQVGRLAALTQTAGLDGVVASPQEIDLIRRRCGRQFAIVTPGIRAAADVKGDQSRTMAAAEALAAGATYLVVGRPIIAAKDPRAAADRIAAECRTVIGSDPSGLGRHVRGIRGV